MLDVEGTQYDALIKDVAYNPVAGRIDEIDFPNTLPTTYPSLLSFFALMSMLRFSAFKVFILSFPPKI